MWSHIFSFTNSKNTICFHKIQSKEVNNRSKHSFLQAFPATSLGDGAINVISRWIHCFAENQLQASKVTFGHNISIPISVMFASLQNQASGSVGQKDYEPHWLVINGHICCVAPPPNLQTIAAAEASDEKQLSPISSVNGEGEIYQNHRSHARPVDTLITQK